MAKKLKASKKLQVKTEDRRPKTEDIPDDWEIFEEEVKQKKPEKERHISNGPLWVIFIVVLVGFFLAGMFGRAPPKEKQQTTIYGIPMESIGDPVASIKSIADRHTVGKTLGNTDAEINALLEIGTVIGTSNLVTHGGEYTLTVGITDRTGIFIEDKLASIEGRDKAELWTAVWTFNSILSGTEIESDVPLYSVQDLLTLTANVSLVIDLDDACPSYARVISASSDIMQSLGFWQASQGYTIYQYNETGGVCQVQFTFPDNSLAAYNECPVGDTRSFVVTIRASDSNRIIITDTGILFLYSSCDAMFKNSVIVRDMLAPDVLTGTRNFQMPEVVM